MHVCLSFPPNERIKDDKKQKDKEYFIFLQKNVKFIVSQYFLTDLLHYIYLQSGIIYITLIYSLIIYTFKTCIHGFKHKNYII